MEKLKKGDWIVTLMDTRTLKKGAWLKVLDVPNGENYSITAINENATQKYFSKRDEGVKYKKIPFDPTKNYKIATRGNADLAKKVQEKFFELGYGWFCDGKEVKYTNSYGFCVESNKKIKNYSVLNNYAKDPKIELYPSDLGITHIDWLDACVKADNFVDKPAEKPEKQEFAHGELLYGTNKGSEREWLFTFNSNGGRLDSRLSSFCFTTNICKNDWHNFNSISSGSSVVRKATEEDIQRLNSLGYKVKNYKFVKIEKEEEFKDGDWVVFLVDKATKLGLNTIVWNKPYVIQVDQSLSTSLRFRSSEMKLAGMTYDFKLLITSTCSNDKRCFRKATLTEIQSEQQRRSSMEEKKDSKGRALREFKKGAWYKNPMHSEMDYGRIEKVEITSVRDKYFYNQVFFDRIIKNGKEIECKETQSNSDFDQEMIEVNYEDIKPKSNEFSLITDSDFSIGDRVEIVDTGRCYSLYDTAFTAIGFNNVNSNLCKNGQQGTVFHACYHPMFSTEVMLSINLDNGKQCLIGKKGVKKITKLNNDDYWEDGITPRRVKCIVSASKFYKKGAVYAVNRRGQVIINTLDDFTLWNNQSNGFSKFEPVLTATDESLVKNTKIHKPGVAGKCLEVYFSERWYDPNSSLTHTWPDIRIQSKLPRTSQEALKELIKSRKRKKTGFSIPAIFPTTKIRSTY